MARANTGYQEQYRGLTNAQRAQLGKAWAAPEHVSPPDYKCSKCGKLTMLTQAADGGRICYDCLQKDDDEWLRVADGYDPTCGMQSAEEWARGFLLLLFEDWLRMEIARLCSPTCWADRNWFDRVRIEARGWNSAVAIYLAAVAPKATTPQQPDIVYRKPSEAELACRRLATNPKHWDAMFEAQQRWHAGKGKVVAVCM